MERKAKRSKNVALYDAQAVNEASGGSKHELAKALAELLDVCNHSRGMVNDYKIFKKYVPRLIKAYCIMSDLNNDAIAVMEEATGKAARNQNKRWTQEEDELLIDFVCSDNPSQIDLATTFGRTPAAVKSRISQLVGIGRISQQVAGRFIGTINGEEIEGKISGTLLKANAH